MEEYNLLDLVESPSLAEPQRIHRFWKKVKLKIERKKINFEWNAGYLINSYMSKTKVKKCEHFHKFRFATVNKAAVIHLGLLIVTADYLMLFTM